MSELEVKDSTDAQKSASYLGHHIGIDNRGRLKTTSFFISNNSQLIRYSRAFILYSDFLDRAQLLTQILLQQGYVAPGSSLQNSTVVVTILVTVMKYPYLK